MPSFVFFCLYFLFHFSFQFRDKFESEINLPADNATISTKATSIFIQLQVSHPDTPQFIWNAVEPKILDENDPSSLLSILFFKNSKLAEERVKLLMQEAKFAFLLFFFVNFFSSKKAPIRPRNQTSIRSKFNPRNRFAPFHPAQKRSRRHSPINLDDYAPSHS
jgi:hypothetical protein